MAVYRRGGGGNRSLPPSSGGGSGSSSSASGRPVFSRGNPRPNRIATSRSSGSSSRKNLGSSLLNRSTRRSSKTGMLRFAR